VKIGDNTIIGENVKVYDHDHTISDQYVVKHNEFKCISVSIGKGCWIGTNVVILKGVNIADNVIVGAGVVVSKSINEPGIYVSHSGEIRKLK
jgi:acetyltransferase-like isoleucine patch superfamily enzyme